MTLVATLAGKTENSSALATGLLLLAATLPVVALAAAPADPETTLAAVYQPWTSSPQAIERASLSGASIRGPGQRPFIVIVEASPNQRAALRASGALLLLDAETLRCSPRTEDQL